MPRTSVVLPVPGPPVITRTLLRIASAIASRWLGASATPQRRLAARERRLQIGDLPGRRRRRAEHASWSAIVPRPGRARPASDSARHRRSARPGARPAARARCASSTTAAGASSSSPSRSRASASGRAVSPSSAASRSTSAIAAPIRCTESGATPELERDLVGGGEADAADIAGQGVGVVADGLRWRRARRLRGCGWRGPG